MSNQNLRINQIVSYDYSRDVGEYGEWKVVGKYKTPHSFSTPKSWGMNDYFYRIQNKKSGRIFDHLRRKDLNSRTDERFADFL